jgi:hypothetical protein
MGVRQTAPTSVRAAIILIYLSGALAVIGGVVTSLALQLPQVAGLVAGILWLWLGQAIRTGRPGPRIAGIVVLAAGTLATVLEVLTELALQYSGILPGLIAFEAFQLLPVLAGVLLLWTREAAGHFRPADPPVQRRARPPGTGSARSRPGPRDPGAPRRLASSAAALRRGRWAAPSRGPARTARSHLPSRGQ